jgi:plasmid stability protein
MSELEWHPVSVRLPVGRFEQVRASAAEHDRSTGGEVRQVLREHFEQQKSALTQKATP